MTLVLTPGHVESISREHARHAIFAESFAVDKLGHIIDTPSLRFGIVEALGLGLGQD